MLDAMLVLSLTVALTCFFFWVLLEKGCLPALLVLLSPLLPIVIIVVVVIFKAIYGLHGTLGVIALIFCTCIAAMPFVFVIGILMDVEYGIDIFKWNIRWNRDPKKQLKRFVKAGERRNKRLLRKASKRRKAVEKAMGKEN
ncbi:MAG: hypothetical protein OXN27_24910 [Candidatus Poribacteria bacterium]|nr:hypothetical protein [Candidatus Poribacteria bacterium]